MDNNQEPAGRYGRERGVSGKYFLKGLAALTLVVPLYMGSTPARADYGHKSFWECMGYLVDGDSYNMKEHCIAPPNVVDDGKDDDENGVAGEPDGKQGESQGGKSGGNDGEGKTG